MSGDGSGEPVYTPAAATPKEEHDIDARKAHLAQEILELENKIRALGTKKSDQMLSEIYGRQLSSLLEQKGNVYGAAAPLNTIPQNADPSGASQINADLKSVTKFTGKNFDRTEAFLDQVGQIYEAGIASRSNSTELEAYYISRIKATKIERDIFDKLKNEGDSIETVKAFSDFIRKHYLPKENAFQVALKVFDEDWNPPRDKIHVAAQKIDTRAKVASATFKAMWEKEKKSGIEPSVDDAFLFFGGTHLFNIIREKEPETSRDMVNKLDNVFSATELAAKAEYYRDQNGKNGQVLYSGNTQKRNPPNRRRARAKKQTQKKPESDSPESNAPEVLNIQTENSSCKWKGPNSNGWQPLSSQPVDDRDFH